MIVYIVLNQSTDFNLKPFQMSTKAFVEEKKAVDQFNSWVTTPSIFGPIRFAPEVGSRLMHWAGDNRVEMQTLEVVN